MLICTIMIFFLIFGLPILYSTDYLATIFKYCTALVHTVTSTFQEQQSLDGDTITISTTP